MKPQTLLHGLLGLILGFASALNAQDEQTPIIPVGTLSAFPTIVQTGTKPKLTWDITLPENVADIVSVDPPGSGIIIPERTLLMDIRVLGTPVSRVTQNAEGEVVGSEWVPTQIQFNYNAQGFNEVFYDTHQYVNPNEIIYTQAVKDGTILTFGGRFVQPDGTWSTWTSSTTGGHVIALRNGQTPPTTIPFIQQPNLQSFLLPYLDEQGNVKLGAREALILMELTDTDRNEQGYDLQDVALLITFYDEVQTDTGSVTAEDLVVSTNNGKAKGNNGHGNNVDGVDMSNPGNAPKHETDTDASFDDEMKRGRRKK